jgi:DNA-binding FrmR family transcriptional regulator
LPTAVAAQEQAACIGILDRVNYNFLRSSSSDQQYALSKANLCSAEYDKATASQKANIEASYKFFSASGAASADAIRERQKTECESRYGEFWYARANLSEQRVAVIEALDTVSRCIELSQAKKLAIRTTISQDNRQIDVVLRWNDGSPLRVRYAGPQPWNALKCYVAGLEVKSEKDLTATLQPLTEWTFTCIRSATEESISQEKIQCFRPFNISISTDRVSESLAIPRHCETDYLLSRAAKVDAQVKALSSELEQAKGALSALQQAHAVTAQVAGSASAAIGAERAAIKHIFASQHTGGCPAGFTDKGFVGLIMHNDVYAANNMGGGGAFNEGWTWTHPKLCQRN